jgi:RNA polymerase sigma-70 factor, ECF subfamily
MSDTKTPASELQTPVWFAAKLAEAQPSLYSWACVVLGGTHDAWDVLQNANKVMLEKAFEVQASEGFMPWAYAVVRFEALAHHKRVSRRRCITDSSILDKISEYASSHCIAIQDRLAALKECLQKLPPKQRQYVALRYEDNLPLDQIAAQVHRSENSVAAMLYRARTALAECIQKNLAEGDVS